MTSIEIIDTNVLTLGFLDNYNLTIENIENTELVSDFISVFSVPSVVYCLSLIGICILLDNIGVHFKKHGILTGFTGFTGY